MSEKAVLNCSGDGQCNCGCSGNVTGDVISEWSVNDPVTRRLCRMYRELLLHDGFGEMQVFVKILKRGQKEVIVKSGKEYRYVVDVSTAEINKWE
ncbi:MAG: hypothetical protein LBT09_07370 [Planctomycetaceae bacterium]|jgi:hypothetical protein|nr:hypothetical protein [Planctomycetaceae bacterium]